jgi:hypothetical protein
MIMSDERSSSNQVFSEHAAQAVPVQKTQSHVTALQVPVQNVPLPSKGLAYPPNHPFHLVQNVDITAMTAREEDILTSSALMKNGTVITELIKSCLCNKDVDVDSLLMGDMNALMIAVRACGYGVEYDTRIKCEECDETTDRQFNLGTLGIKRLTLEPVAPGENLFETKLPVSKRIVRFRFMTGKMKNEITTTAERQKKMFKSVQETLVTSNLAQSIVSIDSDDDRSRVIKFVSMMPAQDSRYLRKFMKDNEPGIDMKQETKCEACGHLEEVSIPLGSTFFWPDA